ncbi:MAG: Mo-co oxidoreductase dimerization domain [Verrucomicrobiota bacterium]|jgi:hypothetical protein
MQAGRAVRPLATAITALVASVSLAEAAERPANSLAPRPGYVPQLSFAEKRTEQLVVKSDPAQPGFNWAEVAAVDTTNLTLKVNMAGLELSEINADTVFSLVLGDLAFEVELGEDPAYAPGKTSAFFPTHGWKENGQPEGREGLELSWTAEVLTVKLVNSATSEADYGPYAAAFSGNYGGENNASVRHLGALALNFGPLKGDATVFLKGSASTSVKNFGEGAEQDQFELTQSSLTGGLDLAVPKVVVKGSEEVSDPEVQSESEGEQPAKRLLLKGTASDGFGLSRVEVSLDTNDPNGWQPVELGTFNPVPPEEDDWSGVSVDWTFPLPPAVVGRTVISVRAVDLAGNVSAPSSFAVVKELPAPLVGRWDALINGGAATGPGLRGALTFQCSAAGALSGRLTMNGRPYPFLGDWTGGEIRGRVRRGTEGDLILRGWVADLSVQDAQGAGLSGYLYQEGSNPDENGVAGEFYASRSPYSSRNRVSEDRVGRYNAAFRAGDSEVTGASLLSVNVNGAGGVQVLGKLADGTQISWGGVLGANGEIPLFAPTYARRGYLAARLYTDGYSAYSDTVSWVRPANFGAGFPGGFEFHGVSEFSGVRYFGADSVSGLINSGELEVSVTGGGAEEVRVPVNVDERGRVTVSGENPMGLRLLVNAQTGWVTAGFRLPAAQEGGARRLAKANGLLVVDRIAGHFAIGGTEPACGRLELARKTEVQDPTDDGSDSEREFVRDVTHAEALILNTSNGPSLYVSASGWIGHGGLADAQLETGADGILSFTVQKLPPGTVAAAVMQEVSARAMIPFTGQQFVQIRFGRGQVIVLPVQAEVSEGLTPFNGPVFTTYVDKDGRIVCGTPPNPEGRNSQRSR